MARTEKRIDAYLAIDSERTYQDAGRGNAAANDMNSIPEHLLVIEKLLADAKLAWYHPGGSPDALEHVRKIGGVATRCMEIHGAPLRKPS
jgi:hypothetical protein